MPKLLSNPYTKSASAIASVGGSQSSKFIKASDPSGKDLTMAESDNLGLNSKNVRLTDGQTLWLNDKVSILGQSNEIVLNAGKSTFSNEEGDGLAIAADNNGTRLEINDDKGFKIVVNGRDLLSVESGNLSVDNINVTGNGSATTWAPMYSGNETVSSINNAVGYKLNGIIVLSMEVVPTAQWVDCTVTSSLPSANLALVGCVIHDQQNTVIVNQNIDIDGDSIQITFLSQRANVPHTVNVTMIPV